MKKEVAIKVTSLTKEYKLFSRPKDRLKEALNIFGREYSKRFHALENIDLTIYRGQTVGVIGRNGSGKSTLLKIISGVLSATSGSCEVHGRVSALLELGAGFNPELSGIENLYLQGSFMGFTREEMSGRIDSILEFAAIGKFAEQPVKSYSSGMYARLAFASAISVEPDILIVDEALSVGDSFFQHKCFQKIKQMKEKGVTILLVTHAYQQVLENADSVVYLEDGKLKKFSSDVRDIVYSYEADNRSYGKKNLQSVPEPFGKKSYSFGTKEAYFHSFSAVTIDSASRSMLEAGEKARFEFVVYSEREFSSVVLGVSIRNERDITVWGDNNVQASRVLSLSKGFNRIAYEFSLVIRPGEYFVYCGIADIAGPERVELDQRWPIEKIGVVANRDVAEGYAWGPIEIEVDEE